MDQFAGKGKLRTGGMIRSFDLDSHSHVHMSAARARLITAANGVRNGRGGHGRRGGEEILVTHRQIPCKGSLVLHESCSKSAALPLQH